MDELEHHFPCPHCGAPISMLLDLSVDRQDYIEDCEVCCNPWSVVVHFDVEGKAEVEVSALDE
jgi:transcription elongation factor Elf1